MTLAYAIGIMVGTFVVGTIGHYFFLAHLYRELPEPPWLDEFFKHPIWRLKPGEEMSEEDLRKLDRVDEVIMN